MAALFLAGGVFLYRADQNLKRGDSFPGMVPEDADWAVFVPDFPAAWRRFEAHPVGGLLREHYPRAQSEAVLAARLATGVRPTPGRWSAWLGRPVMLGWRGGEWGACLRPGLLLRAALRGADSMGGAHTLFGVHHAWRDGILLISPSREYVRDAVTAPHSLRPPALPAGYDVCWFMPDKAAELRFELVEAGVVRCEGHVPWTPMPQETGRAPLVTAAWPDSPAIALAVSDADMLKVFSSVPFLVGEWLKGNAPLFNVPHPNRLVVLSPPRTAFNLAWYGLRWNGAAPFPRMAALWCSSEPVTTHPLFLAVRQDPVSRPFFWAEREGLMFPLLGPDLTLCLLPLDENSLLVSTQETLMARVAELKTGQDFGKVCLLLRVEGASLAGELEQAARRAASFGWIPEMEERDLERDVFPMLRVLRGLGTFELKGTPCSGGVCLAGTLEPGSGHQKVSAYVAD